MGAGEWRGGGLPCRGCIMGRGMQALKAPAPSSEVTRELQLGGNSLSGPVNASMARCQVQEGMQQARRLICDKRHPQENGEQNTDVAMYHVLWLLSATVRLCLPCRTCRQACRLS